MLRKSSWLDILLVTLSLLISVLRVLGYRSESYQAIAHLVMGGVLFLMLSTPRHFYLILLLGLLGVETSCASMTILHGFWSVVGLVLGTLLLITSGVLVWLLVILKFLEKLFSGEE